MDWFLYDNGLRLNFLRRKLVTNYEWAQSGLSLKTILNLGKINMFFFFYLSGKGLHLCRRERLLRAFLTIKEKPHHKLQILSLII